MSSRDELTRLDPFLFGCALTEQGVNRKCSFLGSVDFFLIARSFT